MSESNDSVDVSPQNGDYIEEETGDESSSNGPVAGPEISMNQEPGQEEEEVNHVENKEDMFVDAADDIEDTHSQEMDNFNDGETDNEVTQDIDKDAGFKDYKEQREECAKEVANVLRQLKNLTNNEDSVELVGGASLSEMLIECSQHVKVSLEQKLQSENTIRELQRQIEELNVKAQVEQNVNISADSMLGALSMVVNQEELSDYSVVGKVAHVEKTTSLLVEQYRWFLYEVDQLRQCLLEGGFNVGPQEDFGYGSVFAVARGELLQLKKTEAELSGKVNYLEGVNRELVEEVEKEKTSAELANSELEKVKVELEQEKNRYVSAKEKLGMAVTKGKALVQQRDSLKLSLAEKTSQLEKCLVELQEKSNAAEAAELCRVELSKCENLVASLQENLAQRNAVLEICEEVLTQARAPDEVQESDLIEKLKWLVNQVASLQETIMQNNAIFLTFEEIFSRINVSEETESINMIERLKGLVNLVSSLQEMISQRNKILISLEEIVSEVDMPAEFQSMDAVQRLKWIVEERDALKSNLLEFHRLKDALSSIDLPESATSSNMETGICWLKDTVKQAKDEIKMLQDEIVGTKGAAQKDIDRLSFTLLVVLQEKEYVKMELDELASKYEGVSQEAHKASSEKDQIVRLLLESSGIEDTYSDEAVLIKRCFEKIKERSSTSFDTSPADAELLESMQRLLFVRDQELMLHERLLEEDLLVRSEVSNLSNDLRVASTELAALKEEKDSLQKSLERSEEKSVLLKEKLSLAVKKGKGLFQDRENLKLTLDDKNSEIEKLKLELQNQAYALTECRDQISRLSADLEQVPRLETDLISMKNKHDQIEQFLVESNNMLQRVIEAVDSIVLPVDLDFKEPAEKLSWLAGYMNECQKAKSHAEQELVRVEKEINIMTGKLAEAQESIKSLEATLSVAENHISQLTEEKLEIEVAKKNVEQDLQKSKEEAHAQTSNFKEACVTRKSLEDALSEAESHISFVVKEREEAQLSKAAKETELEKVREEVTVHTEELKEAYTTIKYLKDALSQTEANVSLLSEQNTQFQVEKTDLENELKKLKEEVESYASRMENATRTMQLFEKAQLSRASMETELQKMRGEVAVQTEKLTEAYKSIKFLEDALSQAEANVSLLSEQNTQFQVEKTDSENELKKLKEEVESYSSRMENATRTMQLFEKAQLSRASMETELQKMRGEVAVQTEKLTEAYKSIEFLEDALSQAEANVSLLSEQNSNFQVGITDLENEPRKLKEEAADTTITKNQLQNAQLSRAAMETELEKLREDVAVQTEKLNESYRTIKSLEDTISLAETNASLLSDQNNHFQAGRTTLANELEKLKEEASSHASSFANTSATIKSLEDALLKAGNDISVLEGEKRIAEQEICTLNSRLKTCMDELAGMHTSIENRSEELIHHLSDLQRLMRSKSMLSMVRPHFDQEFENLKIMDRILREIKDHFVHKGSEVLPSHLAMEEDLYVEKPFPSDLGNTVNAEMDDVSLNSADGDNISELLKKAIEEFQLHSSNFSGNFECFSSCIVEFIEALLVRLRLTKDAVTNIFEHMESMKQSMKNMEINIEEKDKKIIMLEKDCRVLLSACTKATGKLQFEVKNNLLDLGCTPELEKLNHSTIPAEVTEVDVDGVEHDSTYDNTVENLLLATTKVCAQTKLFESTSNVAASTIEELQKQLSENRAVYENALDEKSIIQDRVTALETEVKALQNSCQELKYEATEKLKEKEAELLQQNFSMKAQEADMLMAPSELRILFDKIRMVEIPCIDSEVGDVESPDSAVLQKLYYIIDSVPKLHNQINTLSHEKDKLQSTLSMQDLEIERLKKESEMLIRYRQESESMRAEMSEITSSLEKIIETLGGSEIVGYKKSVDVQRLLPLVEKHIVALILEAKSSKSQADELGSRLLVSQKVIDELSTKIKVLEDSFESKTVPPEVVQERSIFEAASLPTSSEISESEDVVSVGKNSISPVASAAQLRTMRKGSTDHLVLNVDPESASLINNGETDEDKGHVFKSLNTSGLIPRQGKSLADRLDGIWVSGGRVLMSRPRARLGLIAYCLLLHLWLLGTIL